MSKNCRIEFVDGKLVCLCNHRDYRNCDLYEEDDETYDDWEVKEEGKMNNKYKPMDDSWICPYCGKKVYSMEVHPCTQPTC